MPIASTLVIVVALALFFSRHRRNQERIQRVSKPVLALLHDNQDRCAELQSEIRKLASVAEQESELEPIGAYLLGEGSLELAEIEESLEILSELIAPFGSESTPPFDALRAFLDSHEAFCRFLIAQPDGEPELFANRSDALLGEIQEVSTEADARVPLNRKEEQDYLYTHHGRIARARDTALTYLLELESERADTAFQEIEAADTIDMERRIRQIEDHELMKAGLESRDERRRYRIKESRKVDPLAVRPKADPLPTGADATPEQRVLSAKARLWQPRAEEAIRETRAIALGLIEMIGGGSYPPDLLGECRKLLAAVNHLPRDRIEPAPEPFLKETIEGAIRGWRVAAEQCLEENFFALDSNLTTSEASWQETQDRILELTVRD